MESNRNLLLEFIQKYPGADSGFIKECGNIGFSSVSTTLTKLCTDQLIRSEGTPKKFFLTEKGQEILETGGIPHRRGGSRTSNYSLQVATYLGDEFVCRKQIAESIGCEADNITWVLGLLEKMKAVDVIKQVPLGGKRKVKHYRKNKNMTAAIKLIKPKARAPLKSQRVLNYEQGLNKETQASNCVSKQLLMTNKPNDIDKSKTLQYLNGQAEKAEIANKLKFLESILSPEEFKGYLKGKYLSKYSSANFGGERVPD